jgi:acetoacetyl-CoA synthetase
LEQIHAAVAAAEAPPRGEAAAEAPEGGTALEQVRAVWEEVLGVRPLAAEDDFFAIGGTSLMAVEVFTLIADRLGVDLPPSTLLEAPTIAALSAVVADPSLQVEPLVRMRRGGDGPPLFIVHSIWGDVLGMREITAAMTSDVPVYGLRARGVPADGAGEVSVEGMARDYVAVMRGAQPAGPYRVTGHSFGALIAFEIARQLAAQGEMVEWLGLIDGELSTGCHPPARRWGHRLALPYHYLRAALRDPRGALGTAARVVPGMLRRAALRLFPKAPLESRPAEWLEDVPAADREQAAVYLEAADAYRPRPYAGPVTYFLPAVRRFHVFADPMPVWRRVARGGLTVERVPGPHVGMVRGESARLIARRIDRDLG